MFQFMFMEQLLVKFKFFIQELWERKSLQILYECWRRAYHALLAQLFIQGCNVVSDRPLPMWCLLNRPLLIWCPHDRPIFFSCPLDRTPPMSTWQTTPHVAWSSILLLQIKIDSDWLEHFCIWKCRTLRFL